MRCFNLLERLSCGPLPVEEGISMMGSDGNLKVQIHNLRRDGWRIKMVRNRSDGDKRFGRGHYTLHEVARAESVVRAYREYKALLPEAED